MDYQQLMKKARRTNAHRDKSDHETGFGAPGDTPLDSHLRNAISAIQCGIKVNDWDAVAEGQEMLIAIHERMTGQRYGD